MKNQLLTLLCFSGLLACTGKPARTTQSAPRLADNPVRHTQPSVPPASPKADTGIQANELGRIMILEYHLIGEEEGRWTRTPQNFRKDLQTLYANGYYPVSVHQLASRQFKVPAGKTPFALTFDDSSIGQFRYIEKNGQWVIDPDCAVGILEEFRKLHPDWPVTATFYVLPAIKPSLRLFGQPEFRKQKLEWLVKNGYDIGSHSWYHEQLGKLSDEDVQKHLAMFVRELKEYLPDYTIRSLALPLGSHAKNRSLESKGSYDGTEYRHESVLLVGSATNVSPYHKDFSPLAIERVQAGDFPGGLTQFLQQQIRRGGRFISDGDARIITVPKERQQELDPALARSYTVVTR